MRVAWLTDLHLNFLSPSGREEFYAHVRDVAPEAILISGDIGEAPSCVSLLKELAQAWPWPIYFVLGNHDFYFGSICDVRQQVQACCREQRRLSYLTQAGMQRLTSQVALVGHDGWADGQWGDYQSSLVVMNDYHLITDLAGHSKRGRLQVLLSLGLQAAEHLRTNLVLALEQFPAAYLVTHVPPFREACWHEGRISDDQWLPHFTCHAVGDAILDVMRSRTDQRLIVLCGHTHGRGETWPLPNVQVLTGGASYGAPEIQTILDLPGEMQ